MEKLGIIGGLGPASTVDYYNGIVAGCLSAAGVYPEIVIDSLNMTEVISTLERGEPDVLTDLLVRSAERLTAAGADFAVVASNTPHIVFDAVAARAPLPLLSIVGETCAYAQRMGYRRVLVAGTRFTMGSGLYTEAFGHYCIEAVTPGTEDQETLYGLFYPNLENGIVVPEDKVRMLTLLRRLLAEQPYDALVLGCTELPLMIREGDLDIALLDTARVHIDAAVRRMTGV